MCYKPSARKYRLLVRVAALQRLAAQPLKQGLAGIEGGHHALADRAFQFLFRTLERI